MKSDSFFPPGLSSFMCCFCPHGYKTCCCTFRHHIRDWQWGKKGKGQKSKNKELCPYPCLCMQERMSFPRTSSLSVSRTMSCGYCHYQDSLRKCFSFLAPQWGKEKVLNGIEGANPQRLQITNFNEQYP